MKRKTVKVLMLIIGIILIISMLSTVNATIVDGTFTGDLGAAEKDSEKIVDIFAAVLSIIRTAGVTVAVVILMVIASKYMIASAGDRADIKKYAMSYIIGAVILFGTAGIASLLKTVITDAFKK